MQKQVQAPSRIGYAELQQFFETVEVPHSVHDLYAFNALYRCLYPTLSKEDRKSANVLMSRVLERVEPLRNAAKCRAGSESEGVT